MNLRFLLLSGFIVFGSFFISEIQAEETENRWKVRGRSESIAEWKESSKSNSTLDEGTKFRQELSIGISKYRDGTSMGLNLRGRATNDEQVDDKDARLLYLNGYYINNKFGAEIGDVAASFNPLVLSASAKGTKMNYRYGNYSEGFETTLFGGVQKSSWDNFYEKDNENPVDRYVAGFEIEGRFGTGKKLAFSGSAVKDKKNDDYVTDPDYIIDESRAKAGTAGFSWDWRFNRYLSSRGDAAYTRCDEERSDDKGYEGAGAVKLKIMTKPLLKYLRSDFIYERIDPDFKALSASAATDSEKFQNDTTIMFSRELKARITLKESKNNLDDNEDNTRTTDDGVIFLTYRPDWIKRGEFGLRTQVKRTEVEGTSPQDQRLGIGELSLSMSPKSGWQYGLGWIFTDINEDEKLGTYEDQTINTMRGSLGFKKRFENEDLFRSSIRLDCNLIDRDSGDSTTYGGKIDFGFDKGNFWSCDFTGSTRKTYRDASDDNSYNAYEIRGNYHPGGDRSKAIRLSGTKRITDTEDETRTTDHIVKLSYLFSF